MPLTWRDACADFARDEGIPEDFLETLDAFRSPWPRGGPEPRPETPFGGSFSQLEARVTSVLPDEDDLAATLGREVDAAQARMFGRRLAAVDDRLNSVLDPASRLLRVGFRVRLGGILGGPPPRALRIRALADFYYSQVGLLIHRGSLGQGRTLSELASSLRWRSAAPGVEHATLEGPSRTGPVHVNVLRVVPEQVRIAVRDLRREVGRGLSFAQSVTEAGAVAATSGGFFLYSEPEISPPQKRFDPVGLLVCDGQVVNPPTHRRGGLLIDPAGRVSLQHVGPEGLVLKLDGRRFVVEGAVNRAQSEWGPQEHSVAVVGHRVVDLGSQLPVPLNGFVFPIPEGARVREGSRVEYVLPIAMLVEEGRPAIDLRSEDFWAGAPPQTFSQDETGDRNLLPRLAVGLDRQGRLIFAAVDGRNFGRALGMTLAGTADLMIALGCLRACNLDGGSSKRMIVGGEVVDLASTEVVAEAAQPIRTRPVHTGVLIFTR